METPRIMLLQILATWPLPASPQCTTRLPMRSRTGLPRANASAEPPTMKVSVAALAPPTPPETGASSAATPRSAAIAWTARALATSIVEQSMKSAPLRAAGSTSAHTERTCSPAGSMGTTISESCVACRAAATISTPSLAAAWRNAGIRSNPRTRSPAFTRLAAIGAPMLPRPISPMVAICVRLISIWKGQFKRADGAEMAVDDFRYHVREIVRSPGRIAVLVDDRRADALDEIMPGDARERDAVILLEALLETLE